MENNSINAFALYRLPNTTQIYWVQGFCLNQKQNLQEIPDNAFVLSPFNNENQAYYFPFASNKEYQKGHVILPFQSKDNAGFTFPNGSKETYIDLVVKTVKVLKNKSNNFQKVVLANTQNIEINRFDPIAFFEKLTEVYPNAFVYLSYTPASGWWIGASPETLITSKEQQYTSIALAGTLPPNANRNFTPKERDEQHWVELFIEAQLNEQGLPFQKNGPEPYAAGQLTHLKTSYIFGSDKNQEQIFELLKKLNPTPAVAGLPKDKAIAFIEQEEGYDRQFYAGFIGVKQRSNLQLFVNLRCLHWHQNTITLFAGAGITADSDPESEWEETQHKMNTLKKFLFIIFASGLLLS